MRTSLIRLPLAVLLAACVGLSAATSAHAQTPPNVSTIADRGFGDYQNSFSWSMAWFKGKLYVGTVRNMLCVENATLDFYFPGRGHYSAQPTSDVSCPPDRYDLDLRAEIWQYTPSSDSWKRVYRSPADIPNPRAPGKFVARDIGFRGMLVYREPSGEQALYVGGVTANEYIPELARTNPPRILRTTDGVSFTPLSGPGPDFRIRTTDTTGDQPPIGFRAMEQYDGRMFVTASGGLLGDGVMLEVTNPGGDAPSFKQVSPAGMQIFEMATFDGELYVGTGHFKEGYSVFKTTATTKDFITGKYTFNAIVTGGAGRGFQTTSVVAMHPFQGRLYIGASGWYGTAAQSELIRVNPNDTWDLVVGNPRSYWNLETKYPLSGLPDGYGNPFNAHFWRMQEHAGELQLGTNDWSWALRDAPTTPTVLRSRFGFDVFGSCDGQSWYEVTTNAFDDGLHNFGARTMASAADGRFTGSANHATGTAVWREVPPHACGGSVATTESAATTQSDATTTQSAAPEPPRRLRSAMQSCGAALAWDPSPGATGYSIVRSEYKPFSVAAPVPPPALPNGLRFDPPPTTGAELTTIPAPESRTTVGTTSGTTFVDRSANTTSAYLYGVIASDGSQQSLPTMTVARSTDPLQPVGLFGGLLSGLCG